MHNYTNYTNNFTFANLSSTIMYDQFQEYLDNQMFIPLIIVLWLLLDLNHKWNKSLGAFKSFKEHSADEIFTLQKLLARDDTVGDSIGNTLCPCCANAAVTTLPVFHPIAKCPHDTMMDTFRDGMIAEMKALMKEKHKASSDDFIKLMALMKEKRTTEEESAEMFKKMDSLCCCGGKLHAFGRTGCCKM